jgi:hypothetical protein
MSSVSGSISGGDSAVLSLSPVGSVDRGEFDTAYGLSSTLDGSFLGDPEGAGECVFEASGIYSP